MPDFPPGFKIHILYEFVDGPWGGANQFLKALRKKWRHLGIYAERPSDADVILFESFDSLQDVIEAKRDNPETAFIHRIDGPTSTIRGYGVSADRRVFSANESVADGTVFQSNWCKERNYEKGMAPTSFTTTVLNAPDPQKFNREGSSADVDEPIKIIGTSWSGNYRKGFDIYGHLDKHLDFNRYEFTFVGNSPITFENINYVEPVPPEEVASFLKTHDIYITASRNDPCSNSLIEALHCGLPAVARNDGGHPEIVGDAGELFSGTEDVVEKIDRVADNYREYRQHIDLPDIESVGNQYAAFAVKIHEVIQSGEYEAKKFEEGEASKLKTKHKFLNQRNRIENLAGRARDWIKFSLLGA